uniref:RNA helicase n=1 Tax=Aureoumbra lagunensis TaxID=44058 RepID=A0A7S3JRF6_9STRA
MKRKTQQFIEQVSIDELYQGPKSKKHRKKKVQEEDVNISEEASEPLLADIPVCLWSSATEEDFDNLKEIRKSLGIVVKGVQCPAPLGRNAWLDERLLVPQIWRRACTSFSEATPVQRQAWPAALAGFDVTAIAPVGSGKTLAYLLPTATRLLLAKNFEQAIVLSPTRELAQQICRVASGIFKREYQREIILIAGGTGAQGKAEQRRACTSACLIVATPGRLAELAPAKMSRVRIFILDEADKMMKFGFEPQLDCIVKRFSFRNTRQHLLFTATFPQKLREAISERFSTIDRLVTIRVTSFAVAAAAKEEESEKEQTDLPQHIEQRVHVCAAHKRTRLLIRFLEKLKQSDRAHHRRQASKVLILANKATTVDELATQLKSHYSLAIMHGKKPQAERNAALNGFRAGKVAILIATDVAGRGLDVKGLRFLVNWDFPPNLDIYTHRLGRIGRDLDPDARLRAIHAQRKCEEQADFHTDACLALSFFTRNFAALAKSLIDLLTLTNQRIDPQLHALIPSPDKKIDDPVVPTEKEDVDIMQEKKKEAT